MRENYSTDLKSKVGAEVSYSGWVQETRDLGGIKFLLIKDKNGFAQVAFPKKAVSEEIFLKFDSITKESVVSVFGTVKESPQAPNGIEIIPSSLEIVSLAYAPVPLDTSGKIVSGQSNRLDYRCLDLRSPKSIAVFTIQAKLLEGAQEYLNKEGFTQVFTPCLMGVASESGAQVFSVNYFKTKAYLRQDPQLHRQLTIAGGMEKIYDIGPCWRAEYSNTTKHLCEHRVIAAEAAYIKDEVETEKFESEMIVSALKKVRKDCKAELELLGAKIKIPELPFPEFRFPEVYEILSGQGVNLPRGEDMTTEAEKALWEHVRKKHKSEFYFLNRFPFAAKPFYVMRVDSEPEWARSVDLYYKGMEMSSGGQREHRHGTLSKQVLEKGFNPESVEWFTKFFKYGVPPHGGFAIGIERLTMQLLGLPNIRDAVLFPRDPERLTP